MTEPVRLVIWDLDETFWRGTLTEGGIREYVAEHHELVVELARRGIISSICSKNDEATVLGILEERGIRDYFVFPSISWEPKGMRIAAMIEAIGLRPATVLFVDDNPNNLAEAQACVPGLQVADERFIAAMPDDPRFRGKSDPDLTRLQQYRLLEQKRRDERQAGSDNSAFLRSCDVQVYIEFAVEEHIDRAVELINRTNQLNFTKRRLPEDPQAAREALLAEINSFRNQAGLVRVRDRYGDYGFVGFYCVTNRSKRTKRRGLVHFCFSCRTLGMLVELWVYRWLGSPEIEVSGEVLTDLRSEREVDWIRLVSSLDDAGPPVPPVAPLVRVNGGCEANAVGHYLSMHAPQIELFGNFAAGGLFVRQNSAPLLIAMADARPEVIEAEMGALGVPPDRMASRYFDPAPPGTLFVFSGGFDAMQGRRYRHREHGLELRVEIESSILVNMAAPTRMDMRKLEDLKISPVARRQVDAALAHMQKHYVSVRPDTPEAFAPAMTALFARIPVGSRLILVLDDDRLRSRDGVLKTLPEITAYRAWVECIAADLPWVGLVRFTDVIHSEDEIQIGIAHYDRMVYCRLADAIVAVARDLPAKAGALPPRDRLLNRWRTRWRAHFGRRDPDPITSEVASASTVC